MVTIMKTTKTTKPTLEVLEDRLALTAYTYNGNLVINSTNGNDAAYVNLNTYGGIPYYVVTENGQTSYFRASRVTTGRVYFYGKDGNDWFQNETGLKTIAYGGNGNDQLHGGSSTDYLYGGNGNDVLAGRNGSDLLSGEAGNDSLIGGKGVDTLYGGSGDDFLAGFYHSNSDSARDYLYGGTGRDTFAYGMYWSGGKLYSNEDFGMDFNATYDTWRNDTP